MEYVVVPHHGLFLLYNELRGPSVTKNGFLFPMVRPLDDFQTPLDFLWSRLLIRFKQCKISRVANLKNIRFMKSGSMKCSNDNQ